MAFSPETYALLKAQGGGGGGSSGNGVFWVHFDGFGQPDKTPEEIASAIESGALITAVDSEGIIFDEVTNMVYDGLLVMLVLQCFNVNNNILTAGTLVFEREAPDDPGSWNFNSSKYVLTPLT